MKNNIKKALLSIVCVYAIGSTLFLGGQCLKQEKNLEQKELVIVENKGEIEYLKKETGKLEAESAEARRRNKKLREEIKRSEQANSNLENEIKRIEREIKQKRSSVILSRGGDYSGREITVEVSAYCHCYSCSGGWGTRTADGTGVSWGVIAAPPELSLGTKMKIQGFGDKIFTVRDRGGYIKKVNGVYRLDVYFPSHSQALQYGRRVVKAYIQ